MNIYELQHRFNLEIEKYGIEKPILSTIIEDYINYAYQSYITEKYDSLINPAEKFEVTERISRILAPLLDDYQYSGLGTPLYVNSPYGISVSLPSDLQYIVSESATINTTDCNGDATTLKCKIIPIKHNMISINQDNPFLKPEKNEIWRLNIYSNSVELILYNGVTLNKYVCRYLKKHLPVTFNPVPPATGEMEIDSSVHEEIVIRAAYMYLGNLNSNSKNDVQLQKG